MPQTKAKKHKWDLSDLKPRALKTGELRIVVYVEGFAGSRRVVASREIIYAEPHAEAGAHVTSLAAIAAWRASKDKT